MRLFKREEKGKELKREKTRASAILSTFMGWLIFF
jgi:hypothetical protein